MIWIIFVLLSLVLGGGGCHGDRHGGVVRQRGRTAGHFPGAVCGEGDALNRLPVCSSGPGCAGIALGASARGAPRASFSGVPFGPCGPVSPVSPGPWGRLPRYSLWGLAARPVFCSPASSLFSLSAVMMSPSFHSVCVPCLSLLSYNGCADRPLRPQRCQQGALFPSTSATIHGFLLLGISSGRLEMVSVRVLPSALDTYFGTRRPA